MQESLFSPEFQDTRPEYQHFQAPFYIGSGGWNYKDWVGPFYPPYLDNADWLSYYAARFPTVEIDSTFYGIPRESTVKNWRDRTPAEFVFSAKVPRIITHEHKLRDCKDLLYTFVDRMALLGEKLGPFLFQFPPGFTVRYFDVLHDFLPVLPANFRFAVEVRDPAWLHEKFYHLLAANNVALALTDSAYIQKKSVVTADFTYIRWIGSHNSTIKYFGEIQRDRSRDLQDWAVVMAKKFAENNLPVFGYFNNLYAGYSPGSVHQLYHIFQGLTK